MSFWETTDRHKIRFFVDDEDDAVIRHFNWFYKPASGYIYRNTNRYDPEHYPSHVYLHSYFFNFPPRQFKIRFRDGNKLNCSKANLEFDNMRPLHDQWTRVPRALALVEAPYAPEREGKRPKCRLVRAHRDELASERMAAQARALQDKLARLKE